MKYLVRVSKYVDGSPKGLHLISATAETKDEATVIAETIARGAGARVSIENRDTGMIRHVGPVGRKSRP